MNRSSNLTKIEVCSEDLSFEFNQSFTTVFSFWLFRRLNIKVKVYSAVADMVTISNGFVSALEVYLEPLVFESHWGRDPQGFVLLEQLHHEILTLFGMPFRSNKIVVWLLINNLFFQIFGDEGLCLQVIRQHPSRGLSLGPIANSIIRTRLVPAIWLHANQGSGGSRVKIKSLFTHSFFYLKIILGTEWENACEDVE